MKHHPCPYIRLVHRKNGFRAISFEYIGVSDSYFLHRYIIIKYRSSLIKDKIHRLVTIRVMALDLRISFLSLS